jgi:choline dehydrogenase-like flavoprotein
MLGATVRAVETAAGRATGVTYEQDGAVTEVGGDLVVLAAIAIFNPHVMLRSGLEHPLLGKRLHEQVGIGATIDLDGVDGFQGSTSMTGHGYMLYDGAHRAERAACLIEWFNIPYIRLEPGKWRQRMVLRFVFEDLPDERNYVRPSAENPDMPEIVYDGHSDYTQRSLDTLAAAVPKLLEKLPVESIHITDHIEPTQFHIQGTTLMGDDPQQSVVDRNLVHHGVRNLLVLGSSVFPTGAPANPTLTIAALSLYAANRLTS